MTAREMVEVSHLLDDNGIRVIACTKCGVPIWYDGRQTLDYPTCEPHECNPNRKGGGR